MEPVYNNVRIFHYIYIIQLYIHTCHDIVITIASVFKIALGVIIIGVGPMHAYETVKATYVATYMCMYNV